MEIPGRSLARGCRTIKLARSTYYYRSRRSATREKPLRERIVTICEKFPRYGYRCVRHQTRAEGIMINHKAIARIMRENGVQVRPLRRFVRTNSDHKSPIFPNLAAGTFSRNTRMP
jgi:putative transposase